MLYSILYQKIANEKEEFFRENEYLKPEKNPIFCFWNLHYTETQALLMLTLRGHFYLYLNRFISKFGE